MKSKKRKITVEFDMSKEDEAKVISALERYIPEMKKANTRWCYLPNNRKESLLQELALCALICQLVYYPLDGFSAYMEGYFEYFK